MIRARNSSVSCTGGRAQQAGYQPPLIGPNNSTARAAPRGLSAAQDVQPQQPSISSPSSDLAAPLNGMPESKCLTSKDQSTFRDALLIGVGAQFDTHPSGLSGEQHAHRGKERSAIRVPFLCAPLMMI